MLRGYVIECRVQHRRIGYMSGVTTAGLPVLVSGNATAMLFDRCEMAECIAARLNHSSAELVWLAVEIGTGGTKDESGNRR